jgi:hypothetical protein
VLAGDRARPRAHARDGAAVVLDRIHTHAELHLPGGVGERADGRARVGAPVLRREDAARDPRREPRLERAAARGRQPLGPEPERAVELLEPPQRLGVVAVGGHD